MRMLSLARHASLVTLCALAAVAALCLPWASLLADEWTAEVAADSRLDRQQTIFQGLPPDSLACDTTLRRLPDGSWVVMMLGGGTREPLPENRVFLSRSSDEGKTWSPMEHVDLGIKRFQPRTAIVPTELMVRENRCTLFVGTHDGRFGEWKCWYLHSDDSCRTWGRPIALPPPLNRSTFIRNHIVRGNGQIVLPFQHYAGRPGPLNPRNGVISSFDGGRTWSVHGSIRISRDTRYRGWAENNIVELERDHLAMLIRADGLGGVLFRADSRDGGRTWGDAAPTDIPNPGSKFTLYKLGGDKVALLHNPHPSERNPLALWVSFDLMQTWPYRRVLVATPGRLNYPDGFVSRDGRYLHFAYDDNRTRAVYYGAKLPEGR